MTTHPEATESYTPCSSCVKGDLLERCLTERMCQARGRLHKLFPDDVSDDHSVVGRCATGALADRQQDTSKAEAVDTDTDELGRYDASPAADGDGDMAALAQRIAQEAAAAAEAQRLEREREDALAYWASIRAEREAQEARGGEWTDAERELLRREWEMRRRALEDEMAAATERARLSDY